MLKSMTAYGRAVSVTSKGRFVVEVQSLNRKFLDISVTLPRELSSFEAEVRKWVSQKIFRGKVSVRVLFSYGEQAPLHVVPNLNLAKQLKEAWNALASEFGMASENGQFFDWLTKQPDIFLYDNEQDEQIYKDDLKEALETALEDCIQMKQREGIELLTDFLSRIQKLQECAGQVKELSSESSLRFQKKLKSKLEELVPGHIENDERIAREMCLYADKVDVTEEVVRLNSHCVQSLEFLKSFDSEKGKTLEFILQEMQREVNTIGSKADDILLTRLVIEMKREIEKMREQVQNVE